MSFGFDSKYLSRCLLQMNYKELVSKWMDLGWIFTVMNKLYFVPSLICNLRVTLFIMINSLMLISSFGCCVFAKVPCVVETV